MVSVLIGDVFQSKAQTLVNTVNCVGVMGKGVALGFKTRFPDMYEDYLARCRAGLVRLGEPYLYRRLITPWILNFPTKDHWRSVARISDIVRGLEHLLEHRRQWGITSLAVPPLGCGEGQLEWSVVGPTLYRYLSRLEIPVELYAPYGTPPTQLEIDFLSQPAELQALHLRQGRIAPEWVALVGVLARVESEPYHWPVGRVTLQKLAYFATEAGLNTGLTYSRGSFGPFAPALKGNLTQLVNNGLIAEQQRGQMLEVRVGPTFIDAQRSYSQALTQFQSAVNRVADLFQRMNTRQAELAATVHFAARLVAETLQRKPFEREVLDYVLDWKQRRRPPFDRDEIVKTIRGLAVLGWLEVIPSKELAPTDEDLLEV